MLVATANFPFVATENRTLEWLAGSALRSTMLANPTARERGQMHGWETRMLLRHYLQRGVSKAALARRFGVSRRTIHEWVETGQLDRDLSSGGARYSPRPAVPHTLAPYTGIIEARLEEFPGLSAKRLFDEVRAAGYPGGYSRVRDYVRAVRPREPVEAGGAV